MKAAVSYHKTLIEDLRKDPQEAIGYLNAALEDGDKEVFLLALRDVLEAFGGMTKISRSSKLHRVSLYKMLSKKGNPGIESIIAVLNAIGIQFRVAEKNSRLRRAA
jgi:probable addiction module antidote protein